MSLLATSGPCTVVFLAFEIPLHSNTSKLRTCLAPTGVPYERGTPVGRCEAPRAQDLFINAQHPHATHLSTPLVRTSGPPQGGPVLRQDGPASEGAGVTGAPCYNKTPTPLGLPYDPRHRPKVGSWGGGVGGGGRGSPILGYKVHHAVGTCSGPMPVSPSRR